MAVLCFDCNGKGKVTHQVLNKDIPIVTAPCEMCNGEGTIPDRQIDWIIQGMQLKSDRLNQDIAITKAARLLEVEITELSQMERGIIKPWLSYDFPNN